VDEVGVPDIPLTPDARAFAGNVFDVSVSRTLTNFQLQILSQETIDITWAVYEVNGDVFTSIFSTITSQAAVDGFASSGTVSVPLLAGHRYAIGIIYTPPATPNAIASSCYGQAVVSLGTPLGQLITSVTAPETQFTTAFTASPCAVHEQLTTAPSQ
jgi:hypothetical protein